MAGVIATGLAVAGLALHWPAWRPHCSILGKEITFVATAILVEPD
jgi:hypothetical protein